MTIEEEEEDSLKCRYTDIIIKSECPVTNCPAHLGKNSNIHWSKCIFGFFNKKYMHPTDVSFGFNIKPRRVKVLAEEQLKKIQQSIILYKILSEKTDLKEKYDEKFVSAAKEILTYHPFNNVYLKLSIEDVFYCIKFYKKHSFIFQNLPTHLKKYIEGL